MMLHKSSWLMIVCVCLCTLVQAETVHHYRFEAGSEFYADATGNSDFTSGSASQLLLPGSAGRGSDFPKGFGIVNPTLNRSAAEVFGSNDPLVAPLEPLFDTFTVEVFVHFDRLFNNFGEFVVSDAVGEATADAAWVLNVRRNGFDGSQLNELQLILCTPSDCSGVNSGFVLEAGTDYYFAVAYDGPANVVTFWLGNLATGVLESSKVTQQLPVLNKIGFLRVAGLRPFGFGSIDGLVDELRISNVVLIESELLINDASTDVDADGISNEMDNCIFAANVNQRDTDGDDFGNICDPDIAIPNDCSVNFLDLSEMRDAFFSTPIQPGWNPDADFDGSNSVNFSDLVVTQEAFFGAPGPSGRPNTCEVR